MGAPTSKRIALNLQIPAEWVRRGHTRGRNDDNRPGNGSFETDVARAFRAATTTPESPGGRPRPRSTCAAVRRPLEGSPRWGALARCGLRRGNLRPHFLQATGAKVVGVDYSLPTILKARARSAPGVAYAVADVRRLPFRATACCRRTGREVDFQARSACGARLLPLVHHLRKTPINLQM